MDLLFLFYHQEISLSPSQVDLFDFTLVAIILIMVCPAFAFFNTTSVLFSFEKKPHYLIIGNSLL